MRRSDAGGGDVLVDRLIDMAKSSSKFECGRGPVRTEQWRSGGGASGRTAPPHALGVST